MMIARWLIDARFGHKQAAIEMLKKWHAEVGAQVGMDKSVKILTGAIGDESTIISEMEIKDLAELNEMFEKLAQVKGHGEWSKQIEPHIVSGTNRWEVLRVC